LTTPIARDSLVTYLDNRMNSFLAEQLLKSKRKQLGELGTPLLGSYKANEGDGEDSAAESPNESLSFTDMAVGGALVLTGGLSTLAMLFTVLLQGTYFVYVSGAICFGMIPLISSAQLKLTDTQSLRDATNDLREDVNAIQAVNNKLSGNIDALGEQIGQ